VSDAISGPIPEGRDADEYDRLRRRVLWSLPTGLFVIGSRAGGRRNLMTANWVMQVAVTPKLVAVSVERGAVTADLIAEGGGFSVSVLDRADRAVLESAVLWLSCRLRHTGDWGADGGAPPASHVLFVGEVVDAGEEHSVGAEGGDLGILRMEDTRMNYGG